VKIPRRVDASLSWLERNFRALAITTTIASAATSALWQPVLAAFILGLAIGGFTIHLRLANRLAKARKEIGDLLRDNGALRHRNTVLRSGVIAQDTQVTHKFVPIGQAPVATDDVHDTQPLPEENEVSAASP
jgi:hypothetical protein